MPFRQSLRSAFLRFPCGHGGSQFTSKKDEPGLIPASRIYPPQTGPSDLVAAPSPTVPRTRRAPGAHKDPTNFLGAQDAPSPVHAARQVNGGVNGRVVEDTNYGEAQDRANNGVGEVRRLSAIGPDYDPPSDVRGREHHEHIGDPTIDRNNLGQNSTPGDEYQYRSSADSNTSDYSNHSITHSLRPSTPIPPSQPNKGFNVSPRSHAKPLGISKPQIAPRTSAVQSVTAATGIDKGISDLHLGEKHDQGRQVNEKPIVHDKNPRTSLVGHPGMIDDRKHVWGHEGAIYKAISQEDVKEDGHAHKHAGLCADELAQRITSKEQDDVPTTTSFITTPQEPVVHVRIKPIEREEVTKLVTRETHSTHILPSILPIVDQKRLQQKHYLEREPGSGELIEISAEQAEQSGWDEVWHGDWVVERDSGIRYRRGFEETSSEEKGEQSANKVGGYKKKMVLEPPYEGPYETGAAYEMYGSGEVADPTSAMPEVYGVRGRERVETLRMPGHYGRNELVGAAH